MEASVTTGVEMVHVSEFFGVIPYQMSFRWTNGLKLLSIGRVSGD